MNKTNESDGYIEHRGKWLKNKISEKGYTLKELSIITGTYPSNLSRDLSNKNMPFTRMKPICDYIGIDLIEYYPEAVKKLNINPETIDNKWAEKFHKTAKKLKQLRELHDTKRRELNQLKKDHSALQKDYNKLVKNYEDLLNQNNGTKMAAEPDSEWNRKK